MKNSFDIAKWGAIASVIFGFTSVAIATEGTTQDAASSQAASMPASQQTPAIGDLFGIVSEGQKPFLFGGYAEINYQWNFNNPSNKLTNFRGFDGRHNTFSVSNVALDAQWDFKNVVGRLTLQVGETPNIYYASEPGGAAVWKYIQQAYVGYRIPVGNGLLVQAGLFLSPIGPENMAVKDNWNWSRSNEFFGLPFYHLGGRISYAFTERFTLTAALYNGWNNILDNNDEKSLSLQATYTIPDRLSLSVLCFTGAERGAGAVEGRAWRHLLDAHATLRLTKWLELLVHMNGGFEPNAIGVSAWACGAAYLRFQVAAPLFITVRGDVFWEHVPTGASAIFWPVAWVSSGTLTVDYRPIDRLSIRLEYRHDHAASDMYFAGTVTGDGSSEAPFLPNRAFQDTLTLGITAWF